MALLHVPLSQRTRNEAATRGCGSAATRAGTTCCDTIADLGA
jgi:hypothetical protein